MTNLSLNNMVCVQQEIVAGCRYLEKTSFHPKVSHMTLFSGSGFFLQSMKNIQCFYRTIKKEESRKKLNQGCFERAIHLCGVHKLGHNSSL